MIPSWNPTSVQEKGALRLSPEQLAEARAQLAADPDSDGYAADAVFEGGGVLGIAFLGAIRCCHDLGIRWKNVAGTSAGAITASLLVTSLSIDQIETIVGGLDFTRFIGRKTSRWLFDRNPNDDLRHPLWMFLQLLVAGRAGQYSTEPFLKWIDGTLAAGGVSDFGPLIAPSETVSQVKSRLKVVVSDITHGQMLVLPDDLSESSRNGFSVAEAVRLSMSIPLFFEPGRLGGDKIRNQGAHGPASAAVIVDGGILSNFPVWLFDSDLGKRPRWPTFGFRLIDRTSSRPSRINGPLGLSIAMFETMRTAHDRRISQLKRNRTIDIDLTDVIARHGIAVTSFTLSNDAKDALYAAGYECARDFFLNRWNWHDHLRARGFPLADAPG
jgi:NTE family protein